jgi:hypothetical protein
LDEGGQVLIVVWSCDEQAGWASREPDAGASGASLRMCSRRARAARAQGMFEIAKRSFEIIREGMFGMFWNVRV